MKVLGVTVTVTQVTHVRLGKILQEIFYSAIIPTFATSNGTTTMVAFTEQYTLR